MKNRPKSSGSGTPQSPSPRYQLHCTPWVSLWGKSQLATIERPYKEESPLPVLGFMVSYVSAEVVDSSMSWVRKYPVFERNTLNLLAMLPFLIPATEWGLGTKNSTTPVLLNKQVQNQLPFLSTTCVLRGCEIWRWLPSSPTFKPSSPVFEHMSDRLPKIWQSQPWTTNWHTLPLKGSSCHRSLCGRTSASWA